MDPVTVSAIASTAVTMLTQFLSKASEGAAKKTGEAVFDLVKDKLIKKEPSREAFDDFHENPSNGDIAAALRVQLQKAMEKDSAFASDLKMLLVETDQRSNAVSISQTAGDSSTQFGYVGGNVTNRSQK